MSWEEEQERGLNVAIDESNKAPHGCRTWLFHGQNIRVEPYGEDGSGDIMLCFYEGMAEPDPGILWLMFQAAAKVASDRDINLWFLRVVPQIGRSEVWCRIQEELGFTECSCSGIFRRTPDGKRKGGTFDGFTFSGEVRSQPQVDALERWINSSVECSRARVKLEEAQKALDEIEEELSAGNNESGETQMLEEDTPENMAKPPVNETESGRKHRKMIEKLHIDLGRLWGEEEGTKLILEWDGTGSRLTLTQERHWIDIDIVTSYHDVGEETLRAMIMALVDGADEHDVVLFMAMPGGQDGRSDFRRYLHKAHGFQEDECCCWLRRLPHGVPGDAEWEGGYDLDIEAEDESYAEMDAEMNARQEEFQRMEAEIRAEPLPKPVTVGGPVKGTVH